MATILLTFGMVGFFFILMSVRLIIKKEEFKGTCASQSPFLKKQGISCGCGGGACENENNESEVEKVLARFDGYKKLN